MENPVAFWMTLIGSLLMWKEKARRAVSVVSAVDSRCKIRVPSPRSLWPTDNRKSRRRAVPNRRLNHFPRVSNGNWRPLRAVGICGGFRRRVRHPSSRQIRRRLIRKNHRLHREQTALCKSETSSSISVSESAPSRKSKVLAKTRKPPSNSDTSARSNCS